MFFCDNSKTTYIAHQLQSRRFVMLCFGLKLPFVYMVKSGYSTVSWKKAFTNLYF